MNGEPVLVAIVEDHDLYRQLVREVLEGIPGVTIAWERGDAEHGLEQMTASGGAVDLVVIDLSLPGTNGVDLVATITDRWPAVRCVVVSGHTSQLWVQDSLAAGAVGYVLKGRPNELRDAIAAARRGGRYLSPRLAATPET